MHKYSPVRNHRSKGIKIKHVLRICFLIAACCWLIFQLKRSHYKDLESIDTEILSHDTSVDEVIKLGRKDLQPKELDVLEEEDDEIDENEQYKFDDEEDTVNESEEKDGQSQTANEAREEHYKADDASSAVTDEHEDQTLDNIKFLEMGEAKIQEARSESANMPSDHSQYYSESETYLKSTNLSAVVEPLTILTTKENNSGSSETTEEPDDVQHDAIDSTDFIRLEDLDALDNSEDTFAD